MSPVTLPVDGQTDWGDELNTAITTVETEATSAQTSINNHAANNPSDPHGDRNYAFTLVSPITSGVNGPNGFVQLNSSGTIPANLISGSGGAGGSFTNIYDAISTYGAVPNTGADQSGTIQAALNAASAAGGGEVWVGAGTFSLANYLVIGANTWLHLSEGTVMSRIVGSSTPAYLLTNCKFGTNNTPGAKNIMVSGGTWDAVGAQTLTSACTPMFFIQNTKLTVKDVIINGVFNNPNIEVNGCTTVKLDNLYFTGRGSNSSFSGTVPCIRLNVSSSSTTPSGLSNGVYNNTSTNNVSVLNCGTSTTSYIYGQCSALVSTDKYNGAASQPNNISVIGCYANYDFFNDDGAVNDEHWNNSSQAANNF
jgi:hypothetical protein